jgi:hypothetical protein
MLAFLNRAQSVADVFYPSGATRPQLTYTLRPQLDPRLKDSTLELEIDGQSYQLAVLRKAFSWPPPPGTKDPGAVARLRHATSGVGFAFASRGGIWGFFRILGDAEPRELNSKVVVWTKTSGGRACGTDHPAPVQLEIVGLQVTRMSSTLNFGKPSAALALAVESENRTVRAVLQCFGETFSRGSSLLVCI